MSFQTVHLRPPARTKARNYRRRRSVSPAPDQAFVPHVAEGEPGCDQYPCVAEEAQVLSRPPRNFEAEEEEARAEEASGLLDSGDADQLPGTPSEHRCTEKNSTVPTAAGVPIASGIGFRMLRSMGWVCTSLPHASQGILLCTSSKKLVTYPSMRL